VDTRELLIKIDVLTLIIPLKILKEKISKEAMANIKAALINEARAHTAKIKEALINEDKAHTANIKVAPINEDKAHMANIKVAPINAAKAHMANIKAALVNEARVNIKVVIISKARALLVNIVKVPMDEVIKVLAIIKTIMINQNTVLLISHILVNDDNKIIVANPMDVLDPITLPLITTMNRMILMDLKVKILTIPVIDPTVMDLLQAKDKVNIQVGALKIGSVLMSASTKMSMNV
jgi:hypothetical protein